MQFGRVLDVPEPSLSRATLLHSRPLVALLRTAGSVTGAGSSYSSFMVGAAIQGLSALQRREWEEARALLEQAAGETG